jgi:hypothetical protein
VKLAESVRSKNPTTTVKVSGTRLASDSTSASKRSLTSIDDLGIEMAALEKLLDTH